MPLVSQFPCVKIDKSQLQHELVNGLAKLSSAMKVLNKSSEIMTPFWPISVPPE